ncbi:MAG: NADH-quinone oxidoreductase subunit G [Actinomycetota bacterium]
MTEEERVNLTIDARAIGVPKGTLVIRAAEMLGIDIPRFCDHAHLMPLGACRMCLVEIEGQAKPVTSCTTVCAEGMVVRTQETSGMARKAQIGVLEFLLANHPLDCPMCDKGGECPLQDQVLAYGPGESRFVEPKRRYAKPVAISGRILLDRERCVLCARCTRFANEIAGDPFIELFERSALEQVGFFAEAPFESVFSGNVVQICPVGALTSVSYRFVSRPFDLVSTSSACNHCPSGCGLRADARDGRIVRQLAVPDSKVNDAWICDKGRYGFAYVGDPERLRTPLVRRDGELRPAPWTEALAAAAAGLKAAGDKGTGVLVGGHLADEDAYAWAKLARTALSSNDVDARLRVGSPEEDEVLSRIAGRAGPTYADLDAARVVVLVGLDAHEEAPILWLRLRKAALRFGVGVVVVGSWAGRAIPGGKYAPARPGREAAVLRALALGEGEAGELLRASRGRVVVLVGERLAASPAGLAGAWSLVEAVDAQFGWVPSRPNGRGLLDAGVHPALLPGGRRVDDSWARATVSEIWRTELPKARGRDGVEILTAAARGELGGLILAGVNPAREFPGWPGLHDMFNPAGFTVAIGLFLSEVARTADVVFPAAVAQEKECSFTNWEGRSRKGRAAVAAPGAALPDWEIAGRLASELGAPWTTSGREELVAELEGLRSAPVSAAAGPIQVTEAPSLDGMVLACATTLLGEGVALRGARDLEGAAGPVRATLHPDDARRLGVTPGSRVRLGTSTGTAVLEASLDACVAPGCVRVPWERGGFRASELLDPGKLVVACRVELERGDGR